MLSAGKDRGPICDGLHAKFDMSILIKRAHMGPIHIFLRRGEALLTNLCSSTSTKPLYIKDTHTQGDSRTGCGARWLL